MLTHMRRGEMPSSFRWTILTNNKNELKQQAASEELPSMPLPLLPRNPVKDFHAVAVRVGGSNERHFCIAGKPSYGRGCLILFV